MLIQALLATVVASIYHDGWIDFNKNGVKDIYEDSSRTIEERVSDLVPQMTLEEKAGQLATMYGSGRAVSDANECVITNSVPDATWKTAFWKDGIANIDEELNGLGWCFRETVSPAYPFAEHVDAVNAVQKWFVEETRLGIPIDFSNEGIHGLNHVKATPLPAPIGIGSTWNRALVREAGEIVGKEAKLIGYSNVYAPILDVARDPRWGRTLECYGEDPFVVGELGLAMASGIQSQGVASTLKHYAVYSVPKGGRDGRCRTDPHVTPRELHEIFLYPFKHVIRGANPLGVMCSYNDWNGEPVASSKYFLTDLLRGEYGFKGYVVSDSDAVEFVHSKHAVATNNAQGVAKTLAAGLNVRTAFHGIEEHLQSIRDAVNSGELPMATVDRRVAEVLNYKFRMGLFDRPYLGDKEQADKLAGMEKHLEFVDRLQEEALVLLKNDGLLPLDFKQVKKILVTGPLADDTSFMTSRYGPQRLEPRSILAALKEHVGDRAEVTYAKGCEAVDENWPESELYREAPTAAELSQMDEAVALAKDADVVITVMGEGETETGESRSRTSLDLPGKQETFLRRLHTAGKPVALVLVNGQPLTINWEQRHLPAILEAWFPGVRGGRAIARTLFGEVNPSGKLTVTFPKSIGQIEYNFPYKKGSHGEQPSWIADPNGHGKTRVIGSLYPFGYGLSYTKFEYGSLEVVKVATDDGSLKVKVRCTVKNVGERAGAEVLQLYLRDLYSSVVTYDSVLRGFEKVMLRPGEVKTVEFVLGAEAFEILGEDMKWKVESGEFEFMVGASSEDIRLRKTVDLDCGRDSKTPRLFTWVELIGFDNTLPDFGVGAYMSRMDIKPEVVSLLLHNDILYFNHVKGLPTDFDLPEDCCAYNARPFNGERRRQQWTACQLRGLIRELRRYGVDVFASFFAPHDRFPVTDERVRWMAPRLRQFLTDYGFTGLHGSDGYAPPRFLPPPYQGEERVRKMRERAAAYAANWQVFVDELKPAGFKIWLNTCWTRDPFEAMYRYGVDYRLLAKTGIDGFVVESSAAMQEIEGWNYQANSAIDRSTAMLARLRACVPDLPFVLLHAINDGTEQWSALRHAPTRSMSEALALGSVCYNGKRALNGYLACLADGVSKAEWKAMSEVWRLAFSDIQEPVGFRVVWSDRAFDKEFETCTVTRDASSNTLLHELISRGYVFGGTVSVEAALKDRSLPIVILNPAFFPEDELTALRDRMALVAEFGKGAETPSDGCVYGEEAKDAPPFPGMPENDTCYWKKPLAENLPNRAFFDKIDAPLYKMAPIMPMTAGIRLYGYRGCDGRMMVFARNEQGTYVNAKIGFEKSVSDVVVRRDFPSLPVATTLSGRIAPYDTMVLSVGEHDQAMPGK